MTLVTSESVTILEKVVIEGDLSKLSPAERVDYYRRTCETLGLNPYTKPFQYIVLNDKLTLYVTRDCTDQLRKRDGVSVRYTNREVIEDVYVVTAEGSTPDGRVDTSTGAVPLVKEIGQWKTNPETHRRFFEGSGKFTPLAPEDRANAMMKAETKAKRRVTLSICGLGWLDETETDSIPEATVVPMDTETGEIKSPAVRPIPPPVAATTETLTMLAGLAKQLNWDKNKFMGWLGDNGYLNDQGSIKSPANVVKALQGMIAAEAGEVPPESHD